jgi:hypothetical protein
MRPNALLTAEVHIHMAFSLQASMLHENSCCCCMKVRLLCATRVKISLSDTQKTLLLHYPPKKTC